MDSQNSILIKYSSVQLTKIQSTPPRTSFSPIAASKDFSSCWSWRIDTRYRNRGFAGLPVGNLNCSHTFIGVDAKMLKDRHKSSKRHSKKYMMLQSWGQENSSLPRDLSNLYITNPQIHITTPISHWFNHIKPQHWINVYQNRFAILIFCFYIS